MNFEFWSGKSTEMFCLFLRSEWNTNYLSISLWSCCLQFGFGERTGRVHHFLIFRELLFFRLYFLDLSIPKIPRKFKVLHLFLIPLPLNSGRNVSFSACTIVMASLPVRSLFTSGSLVVYLSFTSGSFVYLRFFSPSDLLPWVLGCCAFPRMTS